MGCRALFCAMARCALVLTLGGCAPALGLRAAPFELEQLTRLPDAAYYDTRVKSGPVRGDHEARRELELVASHVAVSTPHLVGDGRLAETALEVARMLGGGLDLDAATLLPLARSRGLVNPLPDVVTVSAADLTEVRVALVNRARAVSKEHESTHFGVAIARASGLWLGVLVLDARRVEIDPIPTALSEPATLTVRARVAAGFDRPSLVVTRPDGRVETVARVKEGAELVHPLALSDGVWGVELMAIGEHGPTVVANMVVPVGEHTSEVPALARQVGSPFRAAVLARRSAPLDPATFARELEGLIDAERRARGLDVLTRDASLDAVAARHSADMRDHGYFGHVSRTTGTPIDRVVSAGISAWDVRENVAKAYSPHEVHAVLMMSPAHRAALLAPQVDRLGLGVVSRPEGSRAAWYVTELFAHAPRPLAEGEALLRVLSHVNRGRLERGLAPLTSDQRLCAAAFAAARRFFEAPELDELSLARAAARKADLPAGARELTARLAVSMMPEALELSDELIEPDVRFIGVGVARGVHPRTGPDGLALVVLVAK